MKMLTEGAISNGAASFSFVAAAEAIVVGVSQFCREILVLKVSHSEKLSHSISSACDGGEQPFCDKYV